VVCADLNNVPYSYLYRQVRGDLRDSFMARGSGRGHTYGSGLRSLRIDYILASKQLILLSHRLVDTQGLSDHQGVLVRLRFPFHN
jgi:endonuclease/exonuclease/phosphatase family metal-dependent hydrolase